MFRIMTFNANGGTATGEIKFTLDYNDPHPTDIPTVTLAGSQLATGRGLSATAFDCTGGKWPYYVLPAELAGGLECWIGGLRNSDLVTADLEVVNAHGVSHGYKVIRLNERQTGILTIEFR